MKQYSVSELRDHLAGALDRAERGESVVIARRGQRFRLVADTRSRSRARAKAFFKVTDPHLLETGWTWEWTAPGQRMRLVRTTRRRKPSR